MTFCDNPRLRRYWYPVAKSADVSPGPVPVTLLGEPLVLYRSGPDVVAAPDRCPHRQAPLSIGHIDDGALKCAYHGWEFGPAGNCVAIPSSGQRVPIPPAADLNCVAARERYGLVWVALEEPETEIPIIDQDDDATFRRINTGFEVWRTSAPRMVDNFLDISHFPWVHVGTFGRGQAVEVPPISLEDLEGSFHGYRYEVQADNPEEAAATSESDEPVVHRAMSTGFSLPFLVRSTIRYQSGLEHILLLCSSPIDDVTTSFTFVVWRNDDFSVPAEGIISFDRAIGAEDKAMLEQVPGVMPLHRTGLVSVPADKPSVEWRRRLQAILMSDEGDAGGDGAQSR